MTKLTEKERLAFESIMKQDMIAINSKMAQQITEFWAIARSHIEHEQGWDKLIKEKKELSEQKKQIDARIHEIEGKLRSEDLRPEQVAELGGTSDSYGRFTGANFHSIPITSQFEYKVVEYIRTNINLDVPAKFIYDLGRSCMRALAMSGTFEEAREAYEKFYSLDFRKYGVDIPPRLEEVKEQIVSLSQTQHTLSLDTKEQKDLIENKGEQPNYVS